VLLILIGPGCFGEKATAKEKRKGVKTITNSGEKQTREVNFFFAL